MAIGIRLANSRRRRRLQKAEAAGQLFCSFCGKNQREAQNLIAGPAVFICGECVELCNGILESKAGHEVRDAWQPWQSLPDDDLLATLPSVLNHSDAVRDGLQSRVDELRRRDVSWARIGEALGMSRQAAWERFA
jgi:hypothetical protein